MPRYRNVSDEDVRFSGQILTVNFSLPQTRVTCGAVEGHRFIVPGNSVIPRVFSIGP